MNAIDARRQALWSEIAQVSWYHDTMPANMDIGPWNNPLCVRHWQERPRGSCRGCPVNTRTKGRGCEGTPWAALSRAVHTWRKVRDNDPLGISYQVVKLRLRQQLAFLDSLVRKG